MMQKPVPFDPADHIDALRRFAVSLTRDASDSEDLVQDTLLRAVERSDDLRAQQSTRSWLFAILHNRFLDRRRAQMRAVRHETAAQATRGDVTPAPQELAVRLGQLREAFGRLPAEQRQTLELVAVRGMACREAADYLEIPLGTLLSRLSRARAALRAFEDETPPPSTRKGRSDR